MASKSAHGICISLFFYYIHKAVTLAQATELWHQAISHLLWILEVRRIPKDNQVGLIDGKINV